MLLFWILSVQTYKISKGSNNYCSHCMWSNGEIVIKSHAKIMAVMGGGYSTLS